MSEIHYFPRYSQPENFVTNNTLLLLVRLHDYNRFKFETYIESLCASSDIDISLPSSWLQFQQQMGTGKSVVDGYIAQDSIKIAVETKLGDTFDQHQIESHMNIFSNEQHKVLMLLSSARGEITDKVVKSIQETVSKKGIQILPLLFQDLIDKARECYATEEEMLALISDYETFCSDMNLLPRDEFTMFVPPCSQTFEDNMNFRLYYYRAHFNRRKSKYIGIYKDKSVRAIGELDKIVTCDIDVEKAIVKLIHGAEELTEEENIRILGAVKNGFGHGWDVTTGHKFFLIKTIEPTDFKKTSPGGIMGHRYFDIEEILGEKPPESLTELAKLMHEHTWT